MEEVMDRVHLKVCQTAKGLLQIEVSVEAKNNETAKKFLAQGLDDCKAVLEEKGLKSTAVLLDK